MLEHIARVPYKTPITPVYPRPLPQAGSQLGKFSLCEDFLDFQALLPCICFHCCSPASQCLFLSLFHVGPTHTQSTKATASLSFSPLPPSPLSLFLWLDNEDKRGARLEGKVWKRCSHLQPVPFFRWGYVHLVCVWPFQPFLDQ